jgi:hypothetical protein
MAVGDRDAYPDLEVFTTGVEQELQRLIPAATDGRRLPAV